MGAGGGGPERVDVGGITTSPAHGIHKLRPSLLSSEADEFNFDRGASGTTGGKPVVKYRGLLNAGGLLLVLTNARLIIENLKKYGITAHEVAGVRPSLPQTPRLVISASLMAFVVFAYFIEVFALWGARTLSDDAFVQCNRLAMTLHHFNIVAIPLAAVAAAVSVTENAPIWDLLFLLFDVCWAMKLYSYAHVNASLRWAWRKSGAAKRASDGSHSSPTREAKKGGKKHKKKKGDENVSVEKQGAVTADAAAATATEAAKEVTVGQACVYPSNITLRNALAFCAYPTLVYEAQFPRSGRVRLRFLFKRIVEFVVCWSLLLGIVRQYVVPLLDNAKPNFQQSNGLMLFERLLKLAVPNLYVWLLMFYGLFHLYLNILAELTRFGDRLFYRDWWNSTTVGHFWRTWNLPVHRWVRLHLAQPMIERGYGKVSVMIAAFTFSALAHEFVVSLMFRTTGCFAFLGMMAQIPAVIATETRER